MNNKIGLIAEDMSDVEVLKKLAKKLLGRSISVSHHVGKGCGSIKRKCHGWCKSFQHKGCSRVLLVHDRDSNDVNRLRRELEVSLASAPQAIKAVVIPVEELEAWLLSDPQAIKAALGLRKPIKLIHHPESISSPKEYIQREVSKVSNHKVQYVNAIHNSLIADRIDIKIVRKKCPSFRDFEAFITQ